MFAFSIFLPLLYLPFSNGDPFFVNSEDDDVLFGNFASMTDLFPKKSDEKTDPDEENNEYEVYQADPEIPDIFGYYRHNITNETFDLADFVNINDMYSNFSKRHKKPTRRLSWIDYDDRYFKQYFKEDLKKEQAKNLLISYIMHARYEVGKALAQRDLVRYEKRYKLGYLFNRMRRIKTEELKMIGAARNQIDHWRYRQVYSLMRLYERVVHFDMDMRDTANMVKKIFRTPDRCDYLIVKSKKKANATSNNTDDKTGPGSPGGSQGPGPRAGLRLNL